jgi:hypothetical protein
LEIAMRIGFVHPKREPYWDKVGWIKEEATHLGHDTRSVRTIAEVKQASEECDLLIFEQMSAGLNPVDLVSCFPHRAVWVQWWFDLFMREPGVKLRDQPMMRDFGTVMQLMDCILVKEVDIIAPLREFGIRAIRLDQGVPSGWPRTALYPKPEFDVMVIGRTAYPQRQKDAAACVAAGFKVAWVGHFDGFLPRGITHIHKVPPGDLPEVMERAAVALSVDCQRVKGYCSDRLYLLAASGVCIADRAEDIWKPDLGQLKYGAEGPVGLITPLLADPGMRMSFARRTRGKAFGRHTYRHRMLSLLKALPKIAFRPLRRT